MALSYPLHGNGGPLCRGFDEGAAGKPEPLCVGKPDGPTPTEPNTKSLKVRQAVAAAFDANAFNERVYGGKSLAGTALFQSSFPWDPKVAGPKFDPARAKQLVNEAKAEGWDGTIRVVFQNSPAGQAGGLAVETMLKAVGMNVVLDTSKDSTGQQAVVLTSKDYDVSTWGAAIGPDDSAFWVLSQNLSGSLPNIPGIKSAKIDTALKNLLSASTDAEKTAQYKAIAEEVNDQLPWVTRGAVETFRVFSPKVHGVTSSVKSYTYFEKAWIEK